MAASVEAQCIGLGHMMFIKIYISNTGSVAKTVMVIIDTSWLLILSIENDIS